LNTRSDSSVAVLLHLAHTRHIAEFAEAIARIRSPGKIFVNLVAGLNTPDEIGQQHLQVRTMWPGASINISENRGMDIGGMFKLFEASAGDDFTAYLYMHSKSDDQWRRTMLRALTNDTSRTLGLLNRQPSNGVEYGMAGAFLYPYDYFNIGPYLAILEQLGTPARTSWQRYSERFPKTASLSIMQRLAHARDYGEQALRPEVDIDYFRNRFGDFDDEVQLMRQQHLDELRAEGVLGPLPYYPGNFFWIRGAVLRKLQQLISFREEFEKLPERISSDVGKQSRAHAWERALPAFVSKSGYGLVRLMDSARR